MEKKKPHYLLSEVQRIIEARGVNAFTAAALTGAMALGLSGEQAVVVVLALKQKYFYKSMTTNADHKNVYHATLKTGLVAYIKVTLRENGDLVVQFKEK